MLERYFVALKTLRRLRGELADHISTHLPMISNAMDTHRQALFDTFEQHRISAALFNGKAVFWKTSISTCLNPSAAIFAVAAVLISSAAR